jgi:hypothetical protein
MVISLPMVTALFHLYKPGVKMRPPIAPKPGVRLDGRLQLIRNSPVPRLVKFAFNRPFASVNAVAMSPMATVSPAGVAGAYEAAVIFPTTCVDVEKVPVESRMRVNPVTAVAAIGLTPIFPAEIES